MSPTSVATIRCASNRRNAQSGMSGPPGQMIPGAKPTGPATAAIRSQADPVSFGTSGALALSALCCALYPASGGWASGAKVALLLLWGASAVADSPQFSALSARACAPEIVGSALALQNSIGFAITMVSIQLGTAWVGQIGPHVGWLLLPGPLLGLVGLYPLWRARPAATQ